jgi:hypothetical protein
MEVIRNLIPYELGGTVELEFSPGGVRCEIDFPAASKLLHERPSSPPIHSASSEIS